MATDFERHLQACIAALHTVALARATYASSEKGHALIESACEALREGGGDLGKGVADAIVNSLRVPSQRS